MMSKEMLHRLKTAGEYQRKAIRALFPEEMGGRLDAIEKEMKMMVMEVIGKEIKIMAMEAAADLLKNCNTDDACRDEERHEPQSKVKKVDIV